MIMPRRELIGFVRLSGETTSDGPSMPSAGGWGWSHGESGATHTLRKNAETDWAQRFPQYVVSYWIGHSIEVSEKHYLQVPEELYEKVACCTSKQEPPRKPSPKSKARSAS